MKFDPESSLFDFAASNRVPTNEEEKTVTELHTALGTTGVPLRLRRPPVPTPTSRWRGYMYGAVTFALVIAVAMAGILSLRDHTSTPPATEVPEVVLGLAAQKSPSADTSTCDFSDDTPMFAGVSQSPIDETSLLLTPVGELIIVCGDTQEVIADNVDMAVGMGYPGMIFVQSGDETRLFNLGLMKQYVVSDPEYIQSRKHMETNTFRSMGRYWVVPSSNDPERAAVIDFATMEEVPVRDANGDPAALEGITSVATNYNEDILVLAYSNYNLTRQSYSFQGFAVIRPDGESRFLKQSETSVPPSEIAVAPDGKSIATVTFQGEEESGISTVRLLPISGENALTTDEVKTGDQSVHLLWLKSGKGIVYTDGSAVYMLSAPFDGAEPTTLLKAEGILGIALTRDSDTVVTTTMDYENMQSGKPPSTYILNAASESVIELAGRDMYLPSITKPSERNILLLDELSTTESQGNPIQAYDAVSGEHLGEIERHTRPQSGGSSFQITESRGEIGIINFGADSIWQLLDEDRRPAIGLIDPPPSLAPDSPISVMLSEDGWIAVHDVRDAGRGWFKNLNDPNASWQEVTFDINSMSAGISFVSGVGDEEGSPAATPITSTRSD